jgi:hypothetical protein
MDETNQITAELLRSNGVHQMNPNLRLKTKQASWVTNLSIGQLKERRRTQPPQPPLTCAKESPTEHPKYTLGECLNYLARFSTISIPEESPKPQLMKGPTTFRAFVERGSLSDKWPMTVTPAGDVYDFFGSLADESLPDDLDCVWMTLGEYLLTRHQQASHQDAARVRADLERLPHAEPFNPTDPPELCPSGCGNPVHPGRCRM